MAPAGAGRLPGRRCRERADCTNPGFRFCEGNACVQCKFDTNCPDSSPFCVDNRCEVCEDDGDCEAPTPACVGNACVECSADAHCPAGQVCAGNACIACGTVQAAGAERAGAAQEGTCPDACANGVKDGDESDVDCGGPDCPKCADGQSCFNDADCANDFCDQPDPSATGVCAAGCDPPCDSGNCELCARALSGGAFQCFHLCDADADGVCVYDERGRPSTCCPAGTTTFCRQPDNIVVCCNGPDPDFPCCA